MTGKLQLEIPVLLPYVPDERDECVGRLVEELEDREGVEEAHIVEGPDGEPAKLCIHYDPDALSLPRIRRISERAGARLTERFGHALWSVEGIDHPRRARTVAERLKRTRGVVEAEATASGPLRVGFDWELTNEAEIRENLQKLGVRVVRDRRARERARGEDRDGPVRHGLEEAPEPDPHVPRDRALLDAEEAGSGEDDHEEDDDRHHHGGVFGENTELIFAILSGAALITGFLLSVLTDVTGWVPLGFYFAAYFFGGFYTLREAAENVRAGRFEIDFLMLIAATGAAILGEWAEGALLLFLFSLGHSLEHYAMGRARKAIEALAELAPKTALVRRGDAREEVPVEEVEVGEVVIVKPNERIPADGFVVGGESSVDQSPVTGENVPVDKRPVDDTEAAMEAPEKLDAASRVFAGTINGAGSLEVKVTRRAEDNTLARIVRMVREAETQKSPTQRFTDRFERIFVPSVLGFVALLLALPLLTGEPFGDAFYRAMAVLVAASPCALAIATPSAVLSGVARAGGSGVLVKGGGPLENLGTLTAVAFDKTGTLTEGKPRLTDVVPYEDADEQELLRAAVAVERLSDHPLAAAVTKGGAERLEGTAMPEADGLESLTGRGVRARLDGEPVWIGKDDLFERDGEKLPGEIRRTVERLEGDGRTTMIVRRGEGYLGVLGLMDTPRGSAAEVVKKLRQVGLRRMIMISGDNQRVADAVAEKIGLDEARGDLLPEDKVGAIKELRKQESKLAMVGDGVNDAPAMANSTVGIAMGAAGSDVALETADVALMSDDLRQLPFATGLSRATSRTIKQNLWVSLGVVVLLIPATAFGLLGIGPAVVFHEGSTLLVVFNALRLLAYGRN
ncbi:heavy metal translocating P-type ATPase (plasmid) [Rubrobacter marinus]|uniref:Heavy metal translocating P-type ATPase n=1 Tax=Rubrobacter marinus TaxID=2653852 RepID=A0A6G8Q3V3_9ACTN|nr:heavy metal translocating P-type ATPase [Rubrobacter marinus]QIN81174.1 heavy metal translocating P-type ATPase [Rubrobacter marinus]